jgi:hypothetical protein
LTGGILSVGNNNNITTAVLGGRKEQTITLEGRQRDHQQRWIRHGANGLPNNIVAEGGVEFFGLSGNRVFSGDIQLSGTNTIALFERDNPASERQMFSTAAFPARASPSMSSASGRRGTPFLSRQRFEQSHRHDQPQHQRGPRGSCPGFARPQPRRPDGQSQRQQLAPAPASFPERRLQGQRRGSTPPAAEINSAQLAGFAGGVNQLLSINNLTSQQQRHS